MNFTRAIVRQPGKSLIDGLSENNNKRPDYQNACLQHASYLHALENCGLHVQRLDADENYPDSTFVEDVAILTAHCAVITAPGADSRKGETASIGHILDGHFTNIHRIKSPGCLEGGDVMQIGNHFYIGLSQRTNHCGAQQFIDIMRQYGLDGTMVPLPALLHLKTGMTQVGENTLIATADFAALVEFSTFEVIRVNADEQAAANCIAINDRILMPAGCQQARASLEQLGKEIIEVDISEFAKIDGGLTCLSLRF